MKIRLAQLEVTDTVAQNKEKIMSVLQTAQLGEWIVFPECALTGYFPEDESFLKNTDPKEVEDAITEIGAEVTNKECYSLLGSATYSEGSWRNSVVIQEPTGESQLYHKVELSELDKKHFVAGTEVRVYSVGGIKLGIQICRELVFPEPWMRLREQGAQIVFHANNAIKPYDNVWEHIVITRAVENGLYVCSVNNAAPPQELRSYLVDPNGKMLVKTERQTEQVTSSAISLTEHSSPY